MKIFFNSYSFFRISHLFFVFFSTCQKSEIFRFGSTTVPLFFEACVCYFYQIFIFHQTIAKMFLFHLESSFHSWDIQTFVFSSSPLFFPVSHCFRGWSKKNLKVYDIINCLNKNLITFCLIFWKKKSDIETLSIDRELNQEHFYEKIMQKMFIKS